MTLSKDYTFSKSYTFWIDCDLVDLDYKVSRFVIKASDRLNEKVFVDHDFKLYDEISKEILFNCFISNYYIWYMIDQDSASHITHSENLNVKNKSRAIRTNKEKATKRKMYDVWYYRFVENYVFIDDEKAYLSNKHNISIKYVIQAESFDIAT